MTEQEAFSFVESRLWPDGPVCPRCGSGNCVKLAGKSTRLGVYKCRPCRKPFRVTVGTPFESSHVPLNLWLEAIAQACAHEKGVTCSAIASTLGLSRKSAWLVGQRIRELRELAERLNLAK